MKKIFLASILVASSSIAFADFSIQSGEWEIETNMKAMGMDMPSQKSLVCLTKEQTEAFEEHLMNGMNGDVENCEVSIIEKAESTMKVAVKCDINEQKIDSLTDVNRVSDKEIIVNTKSTIEIAGQKQDTEMKLTQKWVSDSCSQ